MLTTTKKRLVEGIEKARKLGWISFSGNRPFMLMEDIEKTIIGILEPEYIDNLLGIKERFDESEEVRKTLGDALEKEGEQ